MTSVAYGDGVLPSILGPSSCSAFGVCSSAAAGPSPRPSPATSCPSSCAGRANVTRSTVTTLCSPPISMVMCEPWIGQIETDRTSSALTSPTGPHLTSPIPADASAFEGCRHRSCRRLQNCAFVQPSDQNSTNVSAHPARLNTCHVQYFVQTIQNLHFYMCR